MSTTNGRLKLISRGVLGVLFCSGGCLHLLYANFYLRMMPPILPFPLSLVYISGVFEIGLGAAAFVRRFGAIACVGLILLLIAVFPANIFMAMHPELFPEFSVFGLYVRLPVQLVLIAWCVYSIP